MELRLLGPVRLLDGEHPVPLRRRQERVVLAVLALECGRYVDLDRLVDLLWAEHPPARARPAVQAMASHLRAALEEAGAERPAIETRRSAYAMHVPPGAVDAYRFRALVERGRGERPAARTATLVEAQALWRGRALEDAVDERQRALLCTGLADLRIVAWEDWARAALASGGHREVVDRLAELVAEYPLREGLRAGLVLALHGSGRRADALAAYREARRDLVEHLGLDPGAELAEAHRVVLADEPLTGTAPPTIRQPGPAPAPRPAAVPAQLPPALAQFAGRSAQLAVLDELGGRSESRPAATTIIAIDGTAGAGKTTLAVCWAQRNRHCFPGGQLYADLRGFDPAGRPASPAEVLGGFLTALGVALPHPPDLDARMGLFRSLLADRRVLLLLDNARDAAQVRPLLPGSPSALVLVTSRVRLSALVAAQGAHPLTLGLMPAAEARELLRRRLGAARVERGAGAAEDIVTGCARLPLALAVASARVQQRPDLPLRTLAADLLGAHRRLDALADADAGSDVRAVLSWSHDALAAPAARLLRRLGDHPGPDAGVAAAASLAGDGVAAVRPLLDELCRANLLVERGGRYGMHDLLRAYAREAGATLDPPAERRAALHRLLDAYVHSARSAALAVHPYRTNLEIDPPGPGVTVEVLRTHEEGVAWFAAEQPTLLAAVEQAAADGFDEHCVRLAWALTNVLDAHGHWAEMAAVHDTALAAARRLRDGPAEARTRRALGSAACRQRRYDEADRHLRAAVDVLARCGDRRGAANTLLLLAWVAEERGRYEAAAEEAGRAVELYRSVGDTHGVATATNSLGWYRTLLGEHAEAIARCTDAYRVFETLADPYGVATTADSLGHACLALSRPAEAADWYRRSADLHQETGYRYEEASALTGLGDAFRAAGAGPEARRAWEAALALLVALGHPDAAAVRDRLAGTA